MDGGLMGQQHRVTTAEVVRMCHRHIQISVRSCTAVNQFNISFHLMERTVRGTPWSQFRDNWFLKRQ
eukprot:5564256-Prorocentrum_lima.AAC.1